MTTSFDCSTLLRNRGGNYAHEYDSYLALFKQLAYAETPWELHNVPASWTLFCLWLGHVVESSTNRFDSDSIDWKSAWDKAEDKRHLLEVSSTSRPELVHALYCADTEWPCPLLDVSQYAKKEFVVSSNGSFYRPEVLEFRNSLTNYVPPDDASGRKAVLVPCSASKPYPSPLHEKVKTTLDGLGWDIIVCTGVLGLIPSGLWDIAPAYDSGMPNLERCSETVAWYFSKWDYKRLLVFSDFYAYAVKNGLDKATGSSPKTVFMFGHSWRDTYENLHCEEHLHRLLIEAKRV